MGGVNVCVWISRTVSVHLYVFGSISYCGMTRHNGKQTT